KRELVFLRRSVWPLREVLAALARQESELVQDQTVAYIRDVHDHTVQVIETTEAFRDLVGGMHDTYLSSVSNRMNEVMKVLTIFASIFIPLTFIAGVYGMNFEWMPELAWHWSYPALWGVILVVGLSMLLYFRSKKWL
ncbi:MAG: magnesium and cobalt transport protein CorA, partial [Armatimonadota bacterium]|nr:magnesium and cobalt transport protein CorA [Armatimonadota bacterium]